MLFMYIIISNYLNIAYLINILMKKKKGYYPSFIGSYGFNAGSPKSKYS